MTTREIKLKENSFQLVKHNLTDIYSQEISSKPCMEYYDNNKTAVKHIDNPCTLGLLDITDIRRRTINAFDTW